MQPQFAGKVVRQEVGDSQFLTVTLDGEMIPWDEVPLEDVREFEANEGDVDKIVEKVKELNLVIAMGVRGRLPNVGRDRLDREPEETGCSSGAADPSGNGGGQEVCRQAADGLVNYASEDFTKRMAMSAEDLDGLVMIGDTALDQLSLDDEDKKRIQKDVTELVDDLKSLIPKPGAAVGVSFVTDTGVESYAYNWTENQVLDGSEALGVLNHIGGDPLLAIAWREHVYPDVYGPGGSLGAGWLTSTSRSLAFPR